MKETNINILLIEDNPGDAVLIEEALREGLFSEASLLVADSLAEAKKNADKKIILILLDLGLPDGKGLQSVSEVLNTFTESALIILTGLNDETIAVEALRLGAQNYLSKNEIDTVLLNRTIRFSLERHDVIRKLKAAERELLLKKLQIEKSERKFRALIEHSNDMICLMDKNGHLFYISPSDQVITGWSSAERLTGATGDTTHPDDKTILEECLKTCFSSPGRSTSVSFRSRHKGGHYLWLEGTFTNLLDEPDVQAIVTNMRDVTGRKEAEDKIRRSEDRLAEAQAVAKVGSWETNLITLQVIWSAETYRIFGLDPTYFQATHTTFLDYVHPGDREAVDEAFKASFQTFHYQTIEHRIITPTGELKWVEERWQIFRDHELKPFKASGTCQDITARKLAEQQLESEKFFSDSVINSLPGIFYLCDKKGEFVRWNKNLELITGYGSREIKKMHPLDFVDDDQKERIAEKITNAFLKGSDDVNTEIRSKSGQKIPYYLNGHRINLNNVDYLIGVGIDITERVRIEQELINYNREIQNLTAYLDQVREEERSHIAREIHDELGQQLTGLKMDASWIAKNVSSQDTILQKKISTMLALMDDTVKTVRRISTELRPGILDDLGLIAALEWQSSEFEKRTEIPCTFKSNVNDLDIEKNRATGIFRIYQEALTNAMRHAKAARIEAVLNKCDSEIQLTVSDDGVGFDLAETKGKKTLGLIGMRERAVILGGKLQVESKKGSGTLLTLKVPSAPIKTSN